MTDKRMLDMLERVECDPATWWWLSFADGDLPEGTQFLGVAIVQGWNVGVAAARAHTLGCNPGGQVVGVPIGAERQIPERYRNRLFQREELSELDRLWGGDGNLVQLGDLDDE